jgi:hypothetical protein
MTANPEYVSSRPMVSKKKLLAEQRLFTMAAVDSNLPVDALDIIIDAFPRSFSRKTYAIDGDYLARLTRGQR